MGIPVDDPFAALTVATHEIETWHVLIGPVIQTRRKRVERARELPTRRDEGGAGLDFDRVNRI